MVKEYAINYLSNHYTAVFLIIIHAMQLISRRKTKDTEVRFFWMTLLCCLLLVFEDIGETLAASDPDYLYARIFFSIMGYSLRPVAAIGLLLVICPNEKRNWKIWIPAIINTAVFMTAFFSPVAFSFDEDYCFKRGPLGCLVFIVAFIYMVNLLVVILRRFYRSNKMERRILITCAVACMLSSMVDVLRGGCHLNEAIMISSICLYTFLRTHDNFSDILTSLSNRMAFYNDLKEEKNHITAVASLDMNGLKEINDTKGHAEGDRALKTIGECLGKVSSRMKRFYRTGGDEFVGLFLNQNEDVVSETINEIKELVRKTGYSISCGYEMISENEEISETLKRADKKMYADKANYYKVSGKERRVNSLRND